ncbi:DeoR/GlpR transcriptional regulator [Bacillus sp. ISL-40]|uniref:DeoR/GlpR family DNA-binding transcription regulator n=1 Tax=unclassified Bacillus (in: firmicutes) TaxID=185979 RepID=UPI001BE9F4AF|nr:MULTISPECIES: DeoR/GlpR family DNA-binding transcription regulator [unclassified Bacillus (in: firmicutes)]MBT2701078.1 DeoR/GlpR transcriptional regulator [Bacillus sp. ISL-40]MBT2741044.1 DeoR/GlpR transcriptional regulator [Bacillus sp. ISL-77]
MIKEKRIKKIHEYVIEQQSASLDELVSVFDVSKNTIRRDIQTLVERGELKKVYGGVSVIHKKLESFQDRKIRNQEQKASIVKKAASYVKDGDIIFIDSGTTTIGMFKYIKDKNLTIFTNSIDCIVRALPFDHLNVISIGGLLDRKTDSFGNPHNNNMDLLSNYNIKKAFMASTGISLTNGVTNASPLESELKKVIVKRSSEVYLLVDHDKFDKYGLMTYCGLGAIDYLVTDRLPNATYREYAKKNAIRLVITQ